jgi:hypothetical protein
MASADSYTPPVADLLTYGKPAGGSVRSPEQWPAYPDVFGFTLAHADALARMAEDRALNWGDSESAAVWAPVHAWRALGQLGATHTADALCRVGLENDMDDWVGEELPEVFAMLGADTLPSLAAALGQDSAKAYGRVTLVQAVVQIAQCDASARDRAETILRDQLAKHTNQDVALNGFLAHGLVLLNASDSVDTIRAAFAADAVDTMVMGDVEDAELKLGLRHERETPRPQTPWTARLRQTAFKALKNDPGFYRDAQRDQDPAPAASGPGFPFDTIGDLSDGAAPPTGGAPRARRKIGRNEPCPCGSGKKAKRCCGAG